MVALVTSLSKTDLWSFILLPTSLLSSFSCTTLPTQFLYSYTHKIAVVIRGQWPSAGGAPSSLNWIGRAKLASKLLALTSHKGPSNSANFLTETRDRRSTKDSPQSQILQQRPTSQALEIRHPSVKRTFWEEEGTPLSVHHVDICGSRTG